MYGTVATGGNEVYSLVYAPLHRRFIAVSDLLTTCTWATGEANLVSIGNGAVSGSQLDIRALSAPAAVRSDKYGKIYLDLASSELRLLYNAFTYVLGGNSVCSRRFDATLSQTLWTDGGLTLSWQNNTQQLRMVVTSVPWYSSTALATSSTIAMASTVTAVGNHNTVVAGTTYYVAGFTIAINSAFSLNVSTGMNCEYHIIPGAGSLSSNVPVYRIYVTSCPGDIANFTVRKEYQP